MWDNYDMNVVLLLLYLTDQEGRQSTGLLLFFKLDQHFKDM